MTLFREYDWSDQPYSQNYVHTVGPNIVRQLTLDQHQSPKKNLHFPYSHVRDSQCTCRRCPRVAIQKLLRHLRFVDPLDRCRHFSVAASCKQTQMDQNILDCFLPLSLQLGCVRARPLQLIKEVSAVTTCLLSSRPRSHEQSSSSMLSQCWISIQSELTVAAQHLVVHIQHAHKSSAIHWHNSQQQSTRLS